MAATKVFDIDFRKGSLISEEGVVGSPSGSYEFVRTEKGYVVNGGKIFFGNVGDYSTDGSFSIIYIVMLEDKSTNGFLFSTEYPIVNYSVYLNWNATYGFGIHLKGNVTVSLYLSSFNPDKINLNKFYLIRGSYNIDNSEFSLYVYDYNGNLIGSNSTTVSTYGGIIQSNKLTINYSPFVDVLSTKLYYNGIIDNDIFDNILSDFVNSSPTGKPIQYHNFTFPTKPAIVSKDGLVFKLPPQITGNKVVNAVAGGEDIVGTATQVDQAVDGLVSKGPGSKVDFGSNILVAITEWTVQFVIDNYDSSVGGWGSILGNAGAYPYVALNLAGYLGFRSRNLTYYKFTDSLLGSGNEILVSMLTNKISIVTLSCDSSKIYVYLNGVSHGSFSVDNPLFNIVRIFQGYTTIAQTPKLKLIDLEVYNKALDESQIKEYHNQYLSKLYLNEDFLRYPVGGKVFGEWINGTGEYSVDELASDDSVLNYLTKGTKYLQCDTAGTIAIPSKKAYGRWEFDMYKGTNGSVLHIGFVESDLTRPFYYEFIFYYDEAILFMKNSVTVLFRSSVSYISIQTWYRIRIDRAPDGEFSVYIKGGSFGDTWTLVDTTGGSDSNPVTDNTYIESKFFVLDLDAGDRIANIKIWEGIPLTE